MNFLDVKLNLNIFPIAYWGYEQAQADKIFLRSEFDQSEANEKLHLQFCELFKLNPQNKQTFRVRSTNLVCSEKPNDLYFTFKDGRMMVGTSVAPYRGTKLHEGHPPRDIKRMA